MNMGLPVLLVVLVVQNALGFQNSSHKLVELWRFPEAVAASPWLTSFRDDGPVDDFDKLDKYAHCSGKIDPYMVYQRNLGLTPQKVLKAGQDAGLIQHETVAIFGWTMGDFEFVNKIAWGASNVTFGVEPFGFPHCTLYKAEVSPYIEILVNGLRKLPPAQPGTLWRGSARTAEQLGKVITGGFSSTSRSFDAALNFVKFNERGGSLWAIENYTSGKDIANLSHSPMEGEVLFPAGSRLEVVECSPTAVDNATRQKVKEAETPNRKIDIICMKGVAARLVDADALMV